MTDVYGTSADFITYHEERGREIAAAWTVDDNSPIAAALVVASEWIDGTYGRMFSGDKAGLYNQEREWPRTAGTTNTVPQHVFSNTDIPKEVIRATYEAAFKELTTPGALLSDWTPKPYKRVSIDGALSVEYSGIASAPEAQTQFATIDQIIYPVLAEVGAATFASYSGSVSRA